MNLPQCLRTTYHSHEVPAHITHISLRQPKQWLLPGANCHNWTTTIPPFRAVLSLDLRLLSSRSRGKNGDFCPSPSQLSSFVVRTFQFCKIHQKRWIDWNTDLRKKVFTCILLVSKHGTIISETHARCLCYHFAPRWKKLSICKSISAICALSK